MQQHESLKVELFGGLITGGAYNGGGGGFCFKVSGQKRPKYVSNMFFQDL